MYWKCSCAFPSLHVDKHVNSPYDWKYNGSLLWNNNVPISNSLLNLEELETESSVGILISADGHLHIYIDGRYIMCAGSELPVSQPLWGAVDVFGNYIKIKSELLSGKENETT